MTTPSNPVDELRAPDPTLTALLDDPDSGGIVSVANVGRGNAEAHAWQPGACDPYDDFQRMYATHARWFAVPCRECFPDAPPPGHRASADKASTGYAGHVGRDPDLAWQTAR